jgi:antitoxin HicB
MTDAIRHGSTLDGFLREEGVLEQFEAQAIKEVIAWQFQEELKRRRISKPEFAKLMGTSRAQVDRLLDPAAGNVTLSTLVRAAGAFGKTLRVQIIDAPEHTAVANKKRSAVVRKAAAKAQPVARKRVAARA